MSLSRIAPEKKLDQVLGIFPDLQQQIPNLKFLIVGDGPEKDDLVALTKKLAIADAVTFTGEINHEQIAPYYQLADLFVSSSDTETQGLTYIEAMAAGLKCVVRSGEYTDNLFDNPDIGTTFRDLNEMKQQVVNYLQHPHAFTDEAPRQRKLYDISADHFGDQIHDFYQDATDNYHLMKLNHLSVTGRSEEKV